MIKKIQLNQLAPSDLVLMQKHMEMGCDHLKSLVSKEGLEILCSTDVLKPEAEKKIKPSSVELAGTFTATLNSILTTTLGAWMGLNGFMGLSLNSKGLFQGVIAFSATVGALIGILNFQFTKKEIERKAQDRKIQELQLYILDFLNRIRKEEIKEKIHELNRLVESLEMPADRKVEALTAETFHHPSHYLNWLQKIQSFIEKEHQKKETQLDSLLKEELQALQNNRQPVKNIDSSQVIPILQPLIRTPLPPLKKKRSWLKMNWKSILISAIPLLYGTFSSLSGYFNNAQTITQQVGWWELHSILTNPNIRVMELIFAIGTAIYFTFSFVNANRRKFYRDQELEKASDLIIKSQGTLSELDDRLLKLKEVVLSIHRIVTIHNVYKKGGVPKTVELNQ